MKKIFFIGGKGAGSKRLCGPRRMYTELAARLDYETEIINLDGKSSFFKLLQKIKKEKPDIIHGHGSLNMALVLFLAKRLFNKKTILTFTDFKKNVINNYKILNSLDSIIVQSEYARTRLIRNGVKVTKIHKVVYGIEDSFYKAKVSKKIRNLEKKIVLYYGDARYERGFHLLLQSLEHLNKDIFVLLCLRNFHKGFNYKKIKQIERRKNIKIMTVKEYPCPIQDIIKSSDIIVLPFVKNTLEPPLTLMEVSAVGKPLITTNIGGNKEIVSKGTVLIDNINPWKLAGKINEVSRKLPKVEKKKYPWDSTVKAVKCVY